MNRRKRQKQSKPWFIDGQPTKPKGKTIAISAVFLNLSNLGIF